MAKNISSGANTTSMSGSNKPAPRPAAPNGRLTGLIPTPPAPPIPAVTVAPPTPQVTTEAAPPAPTPATEQPKYKKRVCEISREQFSSNALPIKTIVDGKALEINTKEFSTGSFGWYFSGKITIEVTLEDGTVLRVPCQAGLNLTVVGSKELPQDTTA